MLPGTRARVRGGIRRWVAGQRAAEEQQRAALRDRGPSPRTAITQALVLVALAGRLHGWPLPETPADREEDLRAYRQWARLRAVLGPDARGAR